MSGAPKAILALAALAAGLVFAGCGEDDLTDPGPASVVPADTPIYLDLTVRPEGSAKADAEAALGKILDTPDPTAKLISLIEQESEATLKPGETFSFEEDVESWLGEKGGIFFTSFAEDEDPTVVVESTDNEAALRSFREDTGATGDARTYQDHEYELDTDGTVFGTVGDLVVTGPEQGFKAAVDASEGDSLADSDQFTDSVGDLPEDRLGTLYADPKDFLAAIPDADFDAQTRSAVEKAGGDALDEPVVGEVTASAEDIELNLSAGSNGVETPESSLLESAPSNAWLAFGFGSLGDAINQGFENIEEAGVEGFDADTIRSQIQLATGHDLEEITGALGNGALFVEGTSQTDLSGALVLTSEDPAITSDLLTRLESLIQRGSSKEIRVEPLASTTGDIAFQVIDKTGDLQQPVRIVQQDDRIVIGYGAAATTQALQGGSGSPPTSPLSGSPAFTAAQGALSELGVDLFLSFAPVFKLAENEGAGQDPDFQAAKPYIDGLDYLAVGSGSEGDRAQVRFVIGLK